MTLAASLKRQLLALGVPEELHTAEGLSAYFPAEFNIAAAKLDAATLAGMLLRFVEHGLVDLQPQLPSERLMTGLHACQFYGSTEELLEFVAPYFRRGLADDLHCVWVVSSPLTAQDAAAALSTYIAGWDAHVARGQMEVLHQDQCYTLPSGEMRPVDAIIEGFLAKEREARARGFKGMRAAGDTSWCARLADPRPYLDYERAVTKVLKGRKITGLCTYSLRGFSKALADEILDAHREAFLKMGLVWEGFRDYREARGRLAAALRAPPAS